jgi:hypothetical protein
MMDPSRQYGSFYHRESAGELSIRKSERSLKKSAIVNDAETGENRSEFLPPPLRSQGGGQCPA